MTGNIPIVGGGDTDSGLVGQDPHGRSKLVRAVMDVMDIDPNAHSGAEFFVRCARADGYSSRGFVWPEQGEVSVSKSQIIRPNFSCVPRRVGDGICAATTWGGVGSGELPAQRYSVVAVDPDDVLGQDEYIGAVRFSKAEVLGSIATKLLVEGLYEIGEGSLKRAYLSQADLSNIQVPEADFSHANLYNVIARDANFSRANLYKANAQGANFSGANLFFVDARDADFSGANLRRVFALWAKFYGTNFRDADTQGARFYGAKLGGTGFRRGPHGIGLVKIEQ